MMGVAERMARPFEGAIGFEAVMDDHAAGKRVRHVASPVRDAVEGKAFGCDRVQPLRFAGDAEAVLSIVEGSSRQRTRAAATSAPIRPATGASALAGSALFFRKPSLEGGFELVELSRPSRRFKSAFSARSAAFSRSSPATRPSSVSIRR